MTNIAVASADSHRIIFGSYDVLRLTSFWNRPFASDTVHPARVSETAHLPARRAQLRRPDGRAPSTWTHQRAAAVFRESPGKRPSPVRRLRQSADARRPFPPPYGRIGRKRDAMAR